MSMIGSFGLCSSNNYDNLVKLIRDNHFGEANDLINNIYSELENSASKLENDKCSGEVFLAVFDYFNIVLGINVRVNIGLEELGKSWREVTGDYDMIAFLEKDIKQLLSLSDTIDYDAVSQYVNDFFQNDYGDAGRIACNVFMQNLGKLDTNTVLIFQLH